MESETLFAGTLADLAGLVDDLNSRLQQEVYKLISSETANTAYIRFGLGDFKPAGQDNLFGEILARNTARGVVLRYLTDDDGRTICDDWLRLFLNAARRDGWITDGAPAEARAAERVSNPLKGWDILQGEDDSPNSHKWPEFRQTDFVIELKLGFSVVASALTDCLEGWSARTASLKLSTITGAGRVVHTLTERNLGDVGRFVLRELDSSTKLEIQGEDHSEARVSAVRGGLTSADEDALRKHRRHYRQKIYERLMFEMEQDGLLSAEQSRWEAPTDPSSDAPALAQPTGLPTSALARELIAAYERLHADGERATRQRVAEELPDNSNGGKYTPPTIRKWVAAMRKSDHWSAEIKKRELWDFMK